MTLDLAVIRKRADKRLGERHPGAEIVIVELCADVLTLLDALELEKAMHMSAETAELLRSETERVTAENIKLRAVAEAAASVVSEDGMRNELLCYNMGLELIRRLAALDKENV